MPSLQELRKQIAELEQQAAELHQRESADAIATVKDLVQRYSLTAEQVGLGPAPRPTRKGVKALPIKPKRPGAGVPKYVDPATGKTWTGFGKPPAWLAGAKDRSSFLIAKDAPAATGTSRKKAGRALAAK